uniref:Ribulose bisphosphate carboxylase/oxygenase activase, chloroplast, putative, expressed n=1 Tax=Oryza sativa subsp. japonica TaxID=39947 RepID=H2KWJ7_ORYSJ|nr:Ribulose bisphosphate carboxylase/oxygenase activase, chloroplast precursor, putative, expressed [Oryza sativa Japonica Group]
MAAAFSSTVGAPASTPTNFLGKKLKKQVTCLCRKVAPTLLPRTSTQRRGATTAAAFTPFKQAGLTLAINYFSFLCFLFVLCIRSRPSHSWA